MSSSNPLSRAIGASIVALAAAVSLAGCGGSLSLGFGGGDFDDPPRVSVASTLDAAPPGTVVRIVAAASDDYGVDRVEFFRLDGDLWVKVATDLTDPYVIDVVLPADGRTELSMFARAVDDVGQSSDSAVVVVAITP